MLRTTLHREGSPANGISLDDGSSPFARDGFRKHRFPGAGGPIECAGRIGVYGLQLWTYPYKSTPFGGARSPVNSAGFLAGSITASLRTEAETSIRIASWRGVG